MQKLRRQFGKLFINTLKKSPTLINDVTLLRQHGIKIRAISQYCQASYSVTKKTIYISKNCPNVYKLISLAHEFSHALIRPSEHPIPGKTGLKEFVDRCLSEEVEAIKHELVVARELQDAGVKLSPCEELWLAIDAKGGRRSILKELKKTETSTTGEKYPLYYEEWYKESVPKKDWLP